MLKMRSANAMWPSNPSSKLYSVLWHWQDFVQISADNETPFTWRLCCVCFHGSPPPEHARKLEIRPAGPSDTTIPGPIESACPSTQVANQTKTLGKDPDRPKLGSLKLLIDFDRTLL